MTTKGRLERSHTLVLVIDVQEKLARAMAEERRERAPREAARLVEGARILGVPVLATEQYPEGLGPTVPAVRAALDAAEAQTITKTSFDACAEPAFLAALDAIAPRAVVVAGMESHICVLQSARALVARGVRVVLACDAIAARTEENRSIGLAASERLGAELASVELVLFDLLGRAGTDEFRAVSKLVR